jgi:Cu-Zn family superoxide dismutase
VLYVSAEGTANTPTIAPRLHLKDLYGLALMIHANGDNYSDTPPLGGGGAREACGIIQTKCGLC